MPTPSGKLVQSLEFLHKVGHLSSSGYPWTVTPVEKRGEYMNVLEQASLHHDITPLTRFLACLIVT